MGMIRLDEFISLCIFIQSARYVWLHTWHAPICYLSRFLFLLFPPFTSAHLLLHTKFCMLLLWGWCFLLSSPKLIQAGVLCHKTHHLYFLWYKINVELNRYSVQRIRVNWIWGWICLFWWNNSLQLHHFTFLFYPNYILSRKGIVGLTNLSWSNWIHNKLDSESSHLLSSEINANH